MDAAVGGRRYRRAGRRDRWRAFFLRSPASWPGCSWRWYRPISWSPSSARSITRWWSTSQRPCCSRPACCCSPPPRSGAIAGALLTGACVAGSLLIWPGSLLHLLPLQVVVVAQALASAERAVAVARLRACALLQGTAAVLVGPYCLGSPIEWLGPLSPLALSRFQPLWLGAGALSCLLVAELWERSRAGASRARRVALRTGRRSRRDRCGTRVRSRAPGGRAPRRGLVRRGRGVPLLHRGRARAPAVSFRALRPAPRGGPALARFLRLSARLAVARLPERTPREGPSCAVASARLVRLVPAPHTRPEALRRRVRTGHGSRARGCARRAAAGAAVSLRRSRAASARTRARGARGPGFGPACVGVPSPAALLPSRALRRPPGSPGHFGRKPVVEAAARWLRAESPPPAASSMPRSVPSSGCSHPGTTAIWRATEPSDRRSRTTSGSSGTAGPWTWPGPTSTPETRRRRIAQRSGLGARYVFATAAGSGQRIRPTCSRSDSGRGGSWEAPPSSRPVPIVQVGL